MKKIATVSLFFLMSFTFILGLSHETSAQLACLPEACQNAGQFEPDFNCINRKLLNPSVDCCEDKCSDDNQEFTIPNELDPLFSFFGYTFAVKDGQQIPTLINLAISTFLGFVSVYALGMGIYQGAVVRARTTDPEKIAEVSKSFVALVGGFILSWGFIVIMQVVANLIGLGSLQDLTIIGDDGGTTITID